MEKIIDITEVRALDNRQIKAKVNGYTLSKTLRGKNGSFKEIIPMQTWQDAIEKIGDKFNVFYNHQLLIDVAPAYSDTSIDIRAIQIPLDASDIFKIRQRQLELLKL